MEDTRWQDEMGPAVRIVQIIVGSLIAGVVVFLVIAIAVGQNVAADRGEQSQMLTYLGVAFAVAALIARIVVPAIIVARNRRRVAQGTWQPPQGQRLGAQATPGSFFDLTGDAGKLLFVYHVRTIVACAIIEGATFLMLIAHLVEQSTLSLIVAIVLILGLAMHFPTRSGVIRWIEGQLMLLEQERHLYATDPTDR